MNEEEFLRLTTLYLEDAIDAGDLDLLNRDLANSPDRVRQFNDLRLVTGLINEHGRAVESEMRLISRRTVPQNLDASILPRAALERTQSHTYRHGGQQQSHWRYWLQLHRFCLS